MIIGITGGTGCGKSTFLQILAEQGFTVLDCDQIYHRLLETDQAMLGAIASRFPEAVEKGHLERKKLGAIVFANPAALADLNTITHGAVKKEVLRRLTENTAIDAISLFEGDLAPLCDFTVAVTAPEEMRIQRLIARESISREYAKSRIAAQRPQAEFVSLCDYTLENDGTIEAFREKCLAFLRCRDIIKV